MRKTTGRRDASRLLRVVSLLFAATLVASSCGSSDSETAIEASSSGSGDGIGNGVGSGDDAEPAEATEDASDDIPAEEPESASSDPASSALGRTGPIRELEAFGALGELDLQPFLVEVLTFPSEVPLPEGLVLTYMDASQNFWDEGSESSYSVTTEFLPSFDRDWFREGIPTMLGDSAWVASGIDEDLEDNATSLSFTPVAEGGSIGELTFRYSDGDSSRQPEMRLYIYGEYIAGQSDLLFNQAIWGWMSNPVVEPSLYRDYASITVDDYGEDVYYTLSWDGPVNAYDQMVEYFTANEIGVEMVKGEVSVSDDPWPETEFLLTRAADGFEGDLEIDQYDPESETGVRLSGSSPLQSTG